MLKFSTQGGMGSELLKHPERLKQILAALVQNTSKPVTCKIRLLESQEKTIELVKGIEETGVAAITVHARYIDQRPRQKAHLHLVRPLVEAVKIPVIVNGDVFSHADIEAVKQLTGCSSVMIGRGALWNCSVFQSQLESPFNVALNFLDHCKRYGNFSGYTKYTLMRMFGDSHSKTDLFRALTLCKEHDQLPDIIRRHMTTAEGSSQDSNDRTQYYETSAEQYNTVQKDRS